MTRSRSKSGGRNGEESLRLESDGRNHQAQGEIIMAKKPSPIIGSCITCQSEAYAPCYSMPDRAKKMKHFHEGRRQEFKRYMETIKPRHTGG